jgi:glutathione-specific gamma-glutamylcyclotransferase
VADRLALTAELVARVARIEPDPGPHPGSILLTDDDYAEITEEVLAGRPPGPFQLFAYGSLIWKPEIEHEDERLAAARGWHRAFCLSLTRWRGTRERPGLMMALDRGGTCNGVILRLPEKDLRSLVDKLLRREMTVRWAERKKVSKASLCSVLGTGNLPYWIKVRSGGVTLPALAFVANPRCPVYSGRLAPQEVARVLAGAAGHWGSGAEYRHNTVVHLERRGIRDSGLWRLQAMVAAEIEAAGRSVTLAEETTIHSRAGQSRP